MPPEKDINIEKNIMKKYSKKKNENYNSEIFFINFCF
jgi:hypothetical protein